MPARILNKVSSSSKTHQISEEERHARTLLEKDSQKYREVVSENLEIVSIDNELPKQCFIPIKLLMVHQLSLILKRYLKNIFIGVWWCISISRFH